MELDRVKADLSRAAKFLGDGPWALSQAFDVVASGDHGRWADMAELVIRGNLECRTLHDFEKSATRDQIMRHIQSVSGVDSVSHAA